MSSESTIDVVRQQLGEGRFVVLERKATTPSSKKDRAATSEVWLARPDGHLAWRGEPESPGLGQWPEGMLRYGRAKSEAASR